MKITLPERVSGMKDALLVLEIEFPIATLERTVTVEVAGPVEPMDLKGTGPGGTYTVPVGLERLHVPLRVAADGAAEVHVVVTAIGGGEESAREEGRLVLDPPAAAPARGGTGAKLALVAVLLAGLVAGGVYLLPLLTEQESLPNVADLRLEEAQAKLNKAGYQVVQKTEETSDTALHGRVIRVIPPSKEGGPVEVVIGTSPDPLVEVVDVRGASQADAESALAALGFRTTIRQVDVPDPQDVGKVVRQSPSAGQRISLGIGVQLYIGREGVPTDVPAVPNIPTVPTPVTPDIPTIPDAVEPPPGIPGTGPETPVEPGPSDPGPTDPVVPAPTVPEPAVPATPTDPMQPTDPDPAPREGVMPKLGGLGEDEAQDLLAELNLYAMVQERGAKTEADVGRVVEQVPPAGQALEPAQQITIYMGVRTTDTVAGGSAPRIPAPTVPAPTVPAPTVPAPTVPEGTAPLAPIDPPVEPRPADPVARGPLDPVGPTVPDTSGAAGDPPGIGPQPPARAMEHGQVPDVLGLLRMQADTAIRLAGFRARVRLERTADVPDGQVLSQEPRAGLTLPRDAEVLLVVARRPSVAGVEVPDVNGKDRSAAERQLRAQGFLVRVSFTRGPASLAGRVDSQAPASGSIQDRRTWVEIVVVQPYTSEHNVARGGAPESLAGLREGPGPDLSDAGPSGRLPQPPAVGRGRVARPPPMPRAPAPPPPVDLPGPGSPANQTVPDLSAKEARLAITEALQAGLMPIIENDRSPGATLGRITRQSPASGTVLQAGALVRLWTGVGGTGEDGTYDLKLVMGANLHRSQAMYQRAGIQVEVIEVDSPGHPYAGSARVVAQYPVSTVPRRMAGRVTLWVIK